MDFVLRHPRDRSHVAVYGHDHRRGFFVDVEYAGNPVNYDTADPNYDGIRGAVRELADGGFFDADDVQDALEVVQAPRANEVVPGRVRRVLRVLRNFTDAAGT